ncbi:MAG TPA: FtsW/RodA/SpoVE family cell cycle protein, partial [Anaerolineales bacterium]|nr:FtsW/RodA/SpoVE family cell cycle protein [Anaerolineales bacterium]
MGTRTFVNNRSGLWPFRGTSKSARSTDMLLVLTVIALIVFGLIMLYSASFDFSFNEYGSSSYMFMRQVRWLGLGIILAFVLSYFDYHHWRRLVVFAMLGIIGLLITVLFINETRLGASRT